MGKGLTFLAIAFAVVFWNFMFPVMVEPFIDPDDYHRPTKLYVHNAFEGESPSIDFTRDINQEFNGQWHGILWRVVDGGLELVDECRPRHGPKHRYTPRSTLPDDIDLDWMFEIPPGRECRPGPGTYMVSLEWDIEWKYMPTVVVQSQIDSNQFRVLERPE